MLSILSLLLLAPALAQEPPAETPTAAPDVEQPRPRMAGLDAQLSEEGVSLVFRALGESWDDPSLALVYKSQLLMGGVALLVPLHPRVMLDLEVGFSRQSGTAWDSETMKSGSAGTSFQMIPVSVLGELRQPIAHGEFFLGAGPSFACFQEDHPGFVDENETTRTRTSGVKLGAEFRVGLRLKTRYQPQVLLPPAPQPLVQGYAIELYGARRTQPRPSGFDLGAARIGVGVQVMF